MESHGISITRGSRHGQSDAKVQSFVHRAEPCAIERFVKEVLRCPESRDVPRCPEPLEGSFDLVH